jgi:serine/threonine protein kinase
MGFGLGPISSLSKPRDSNSAARRIVEISAHQNRSISYILSAGASSMQAIGNLLPLSVRIQMIRDCCAGLSYLHSKGIMHCDIKSLNFLVTSNLTVKLADLGEALIVKDIDREKQSFPTLVFFSVVNISLIFASFHTAILIGLLRKHLLWTLLTLILLLMFGP